MLEISHIAPSAIDEARTRIQGRAYRTPLVPLNADLGDREVFLKLENLQPIGSFKLRGALNAMLQLSPTDTAEGVYTASAGNMAQGVAWTARELGLSCNVIVPDTAPRTKLDAVQRLGATAVPLPFADWWQVLVDHGHPDFGGRFVHPVSDAAVIAGNGTIGLEILEDVADVDTVVVPYGGGGLSCGIASALKGAGSRAQIYGAEAVTATPLEQSLAAGAPVAVDHTPSFVDGIGSKGMLPEMWNLARSLLAGSVVSTLDQIAQGIRLMVERNRVIAEGAGAAALGAVLADKVPGKRVVCVVSGGNIDTAVLARILEGGTPT
ncbi:MAG: threonine ammonia-lyase [Longimicrobiales bacterium]